MKKLIEVPHKHTGTLVAVINFETDYPRKWIDGDTEIPRKIKIKNIEFTHHIAELSMLGYAAITGALEEILEEWENRPLTKEEWTIETSDF